MKGKILTGPPELKVALPGVVGLAIAFILSLLQFYVPSFTSPPADLVTLGITAISAVIGYLAPHTPSPLEDVSPKVIHIQAASVQLSTGEKNGGAT